MKYFLSILICIVCSLTAQSNTYYLSSGSGNDGNAGTTSGAAWRTIFRLNQAWSGVGVGDTILFERGGTYIGAIKITKSGAVGDPIVFGAYGSGAKPIISGLCGFKTWVNTPGTNLWDAQPDSTLKKMVNVVTMQGVAQAVGRTPNANSYYTYQSADTGFVTAAIITTFTAPGGQDYVGAEAIVRQNHWYTKRSQIIAQSGSTMTLATKNISIDGANNFGNGYRGTKDFGWFIQRHEKTLDIQGEWFFNDITNRMKMFSIIDPNTLNMKANYVDTIFVLAGRSNIVVRDLYIEGAGVDAIGFAGSTNITVLNCDFNNNTRAVYGYNSFNLMINGNDISNSLHCGIVVTNRAGKQISILNNRVRKTGMLMGMGIWPVSWNLVGIVAETDTTTAGNFILVDNNQVEDAGHMGIIFQGSNVTISRNTTDRFCWFMGDGGGIYTYTKNGGLVNCAAQPAPVCSNSQVNTLNYRNRVIKNNFILNAQSAKVGANNETDVAGFYNDAQASNILSFGNTIANVPGNGVQISNAHDFICYDNVFYNCSFGIVALTYSYASSYNNRFYRNVVYQKDSSQYVFQHSNPTLCCPVPQTLTESIRSITFSDTNYITNLKYASYSDHYSAGTFKTWTLAEQRSIYLHEQNSILPLVPVTSTNTQLVLNQSDTVMTYNFTGYRMLTPEGTIYDNFIKIQPRTSKVLISYGMVPVPNTPPTVYAGLDQTKTLPTNTASVTATATGGSGTISTYTWRLINGPAAVTIATPNAATTSITFTQAGTYDFEVKVKNSLNDTATDAMQVVIKPAANIPPTVSAGPDREITLPASSLMLTGTKGDVDGTVNVDWTIFSGPGSPVITGGNTLTPTLSNLSQGLYKIKLKGTDNVGDTAVDFMQIEVKAAIPPPNKNPVADAGNNATFALPKDTTNLHGSGTDEDGTVDGYQWTKIFGPNGVTIVSPTSPNTLITGLVQGTYTFELTVTDNNGATGKKQVVITVNAANQNPTVTVDFGTLTRQLPADTATFVAHGVDPDGTVDTYYWEKIGGPASGTMLPSDSVLFISGLSQGTHIYKVTVTDNAGAKGSAQAVVVVNPAPVVHIPPTVTVPGEQTVTLPVDSLTLSATATMGDSAIAFVHWAQISGPISSLSNILTPDLATTKINQLKFGTYVFSFTATDTKGATATKKVTVNVLQNVFLRSYLLRTWE